MEAALPKTGVIDAGDRFRSPGSSPSSPLPEVLKAAEVARLLRIDRKTLYEAVQRKQVPGVIRVGRSLRFCRQVLLTWLGQDRPAPTQKGAGDVRPKKNVA